LFSCCKKEERVKFGVYESVLKDKTCELERISEILIKESRDIFIGEILWTRIKFGKIFISDRVQNVIVVVNMNGRIEKFIGKKGAGPGEIKEIMDFDVGDDGLIYIFDMGNMRFSIFDTGGKFINSFKLRSNLVGPIRSVRVNEGKIYTGILEPEYFSQSEIYKSKRVAVVDTQGNVLNLFGSSDEIFKNFKIYNTNVLLSFDRFGNIYMAQAGGTYKIYKYNRKHKLVKIFGVQGKFRTVSEDIPWNLPIPKINELVQKFSNVSYLCVVDSLIYYQFVDLTSKGITMRNPFYHRYYLKVYDLEGNYIPSDIELPGRILDIDDEGRIYIYEDNEPGNRRIGVYRLLIIDKDDKQKHGGQNEKD